VFRNGLALPLAVCESVRWTQVDRSSERGRQMPKVTLSERFAGISEHWAPEVVAELNGQQVKLARFLGEFKSHTHSGEDELFLVVKGSIRIELRDETVELSEGEFLVVPRGVEHRPVAEEEAHVLLFEPSSTIRTGD
jgi:mannose-6-phosphate isomerase-like protein (cupin superfamily)